jgi:hypothetical protein
MGLMARVLRPSGSTHGRLLYFFVSNSGVLIPMIPNLIN